MDSRVVLIYMWSIRKNRFAKAITVLTFLDTYRVGRPVGLVETLVARTGPVKSVAELHRHSAVRFQSGMYAQIRHVWIKMTWLYVHLLCIVNIPVDILSNSDIFIGNERVWDQWYRESSLPASNDLVFSTDGYHNAIWNVVINGQKSLKKKKPRHKVCGFY